MSILSLLLGASNLVNGLAQSATNGGSTLGTFDHQYGSQFGGASQGHFGGQFGPPAGPPQYGGKQSGPQDQPDNSPGGPNQQNRPPSYGPPNNPGRPGNGQGQPVQPNQPSPYPGQYQPIEPSANPNNPPKMPDTGVTRKYYWEISRGVLAPDGVQKEGIFVNGQFPGPILEANWGDWFEVTVHNNITGPEEGTSVHWHGLNQRETPWFDGVPSVSQCPIAPGSTFTYTFRADSVGMSWYHAHYSAQYVAGVAGPMLIKGPSHVDYDIDVGPVMISDYYHSPYLDLVEQTVGRQFTPQSDNNLINGKMFFDCSKAQGLPCTPNAGVSKFKFQSGKRMLLRLVNSGAEGVQHFTIDNHNMTVIMTDFVPIKPYQTNMVTLGVGQRVEIIVEGTGKPTDAVWMRSDLIPGLCGFTNQPHALAAIYYEDADTSATPQTTATPYQSDGCRNVDLSVTEPFYPMQPPSQPAVTTNIDMTFAPNATGAMVWMMNNVSFRGDYNQPTLLLAKQGNTSFPNHPEWSVYNYGQATSVRLILTTIGPLPHPMHLHGHNMWVLAEGFGQWDGSIVRPENPVRRDTHIMQPGNPQQGPAGISYLVLEFLADNPGVWPMHCHNAWHLSGGMYINVLERPDLIQSDMDIPDIMAQTCRDWWKFTGHNVVDQIDAGV